MPRGIYDRAAKKSTKSASTETASAAPAKKVKGPKSPRGRKPKAVVETVSVKGSTETIVRNETDTFFLIREVRQNLQTLAALATSFAATEVPAIQAEVAAHVEILSNLRKQAFGQNEKATVTINEVEVAPVATANGAATYPATVPMPPAPIPSLTTTH